MNKIGLEKAYFYKTDQEEVFHKKTLYINLQAFTACYLSEETKNLPNFKANYFTPLSLAEMQKKNFQPYI